MRVPLARHVKHAAKGCVRYFGSITLDVWINVLKELCMMYFAAVFVIPLAVPLGTFAYVTPFPTGFVRADTPIGALMRQLVAIELGAAFGIYYAIALLYVFPYSGIAHCGFISLLVLISSWMRAYQPELAQAYTFMGLLSVVAVSAGNNQTAEYINTMGWQLVSAVTVGVGTVLFFTVLVFPVMASFRYRRHMADSLKLSALIIKLSSEILLEQVPEPSTEELILGFSERVPRPIDLEQQQQPPAAEIPRPPSRPPPPPPPPQRPPPRPPPETTVEQEERGPEEHGPQPPPPGPPLIKTRRFSTVSPYVFPPSQAAPSSPASSASSSKISLATASEIELAREHASVAGDEQTSRGNAEVSSTPHGGAIGLVPERIASPAIGNIFYLPSRRPSRHRAVPPSRGSPPGSSGGSSGESSSLSSASEISTLSLPSPMRPLNGALAAAVAAAAAAPYPATTFNQPMVDVTSSQPPPPPPLNRPYDSGSVSSTSPAMEAKLATLNELITKIQRLLAGIRRLQYDAKFELGHALFKSNQLDLVITAHSRLMQLVIALAVVAREHHGLRTSFCRRLASTFTPNSANAWTLSGSGGGRAVVAHVTMFEHFMDAFEGPLGATMAHLGAAFGDLSVRVRRYKVDVNEPERWPGVDQEELGHSRQQREFLSLFGVGVDMHPLFYLIFVLRELRMQLHMFSTCEANLRVTLPLYNYLRPSHYRKPDLSGAMASVGTYPLRERTEHRINTPEEGVPLWRFKLWRFASILESTQFRYAVKTTLAFLIVALPFFLIPALQTFRFYWALFTVIGVSSPTHGASIQLAVSRFVGMIIAVAFSILTFLAAGYHPVTLVFVFIPFFVLAAFIKGATPYFRVASQALITYSITVLSLYVNQDTPDYPTIYQLAYERVISTSAGILSAVIVGRIFWPFLARVELRKMVARAIYDAGISFIQTQSLFRQGFIRPTDTRLLVRLLAVVQNDLNVAESLFEWTVQEPRLKGPSVTQRFISIVRSLHLIHNHLVSAAILIDRGVGIELRDQVLVLLRRERREYFITLSQLFYLLASSVRTKFPLPNYLPDPACAVRRLIRKLRTLPAMTSHYPPMQAIHYYAFVNVSKEIAHELARIQMEILKLYGVNRILALERDATFFALEDIV